MRLYPLLSVLAAVLLVGCVKDRDAELKVADFEVFTLVLPPNWDTFAGQGIDSRVGGITDGRDTLRYDYGWYSYRFQKETTATHKRTDLLIDSRPALLVEPKQPSKGLIGIYIQVDGMNRFNLYGRNLKNQATATQIMRSVKFK